MKKIVAVNFGSSFHLLDHIAPIADILGIELLVNEEIMYDLLKKYYPQIKFCYKQDLSFNFLANNYNTLISCNYWFLEDKLAFLQAYNKDMKLIFCPHGNSDKGHANPANIELFKNQDIVFLYGNHMIDLLKKLNIFPQIKKHLVIGNYRYSFYKKHKKFYDQILDKEVFSKLNPHNKTILYAPTWKDNENSSSFFHFFEKIIKQVPEHYNLIIKIHPNLEAKNSLEFYKIYNEVSASNILFLHKNPLIYPILNRCDIYLGDFSSIGYDFLHFQRPMFFLDHLNRNNLNDPNLFLFQCGYNIPKENWNHIFTFIEKFLDKSSRDIQKQVYKYAFGKEVSLNETRNKILNIIA